jgi:membrane protease YdiL (CAAX protease family)
MAVLGNFWIVAVLVAPTCEELGFRGVLMALLRSRVPFYIAVLAVSITFAVYHVAAYGLGMSAAYTGAFLFSVLACIVAKWRNSLVACMIMHAIFNGFILAKMVMVGL